jgi:hypothetical protein
MSDFDDFGISGKLVMSTFQRHTFFRNSSLIQQTTALGTRAAIVISLTTNRFPIEIPVDPEMLLTNRDIPIVDNISYFKKGATF